MQRVVAAVRTGYSGKLQDLYRGDYTAIGIRDRRLEPYGLYQRHGANCLEPLLQEFEAIIFAGVTCLEVYVCISSTDVFT
jgi:hypothetical protein